MTHKRHIHFCWTWLLCTVTLSALAGEGDIFYVNKAGTNERQDGLSWATAFRDLQPAIDAANRDFGGEIWVAQGLYDEPRAEEGSLVLKEGVKLLGGFRGSETTTGERDPKQYRCVIDGSKARAGDAAEHVIRVTGQSELDGFIVQGGHGQNGAGFFCEGVTFTAKQCTFRNNRAEIAGGAFFISGDAYVTLEDSTFEANVSGQSGGAGAVQEATLLCRASKFDTNNAGQVGGALACTLGSDVLLEDCEFVRNTSVNGGAVFSDAGTLSVERSLFFVNSADNLGGALFINNQTLLAVNCVLAKNTAKKRGAAVAGLNADLSVIHCTVADNRADSGGGFLFAQTGDVYILNSIVWGNRPSVFDTQGTAILAQYSDIEGRLAGTGNMNLSPRFRNPESWDYRLQPNSFCIDAATASGAAAMDADGRARPVGRGYDMGAYEAVDIGPREPLVVKLLTCAPDSEDHSSGVLTDLLLVLITIFFMYGGRGYYRYARHKRAYSSHN